MGRDGAREESEGGGSCWNVRCAALLDVKSSTTRIPRSGGLGWALGPVLRIAAQQVSESLSDSSPEAFVPFVDRPALSGITVW